MSIPAKPEDFANPETREDWRRSKGMITLKLWSDQHQRTPVDIFVYEPFDFAKEYATATTLEVSPGVAEPLEVIPGYDEETRLQYAGGLPEDTGEESLAE